MINKLLIITGGKRWLKFILNALFFISIGGCTSSNEPTAPSTATLDREGTLWGSFIEWTVNNSSYDGNPFDVNAEVLFTHENSNEVRKTEMFYDGNNTWKFRFTGTKTGTWKFHSSSNDPELDKLSGTINIAEGIGDKRGFIISKGTKWVRTGDDNDLAYIPQLAMYSDPHLFYQNSAKIDKDIKLFIEKHGFSGFHVGIYCRWFDIDGTFIKNYRPECKSSYKNPDIRTFEAIENLIFKTYNAGGVVHLWAWGDNQRRHNANYLDGGINGNVDQRLQRYIAARLGPLPGWTMGYGFDLWEWVNKNQLNEWHDFMHSKMFWPHMLGARSGKKKLNQISELMDYSSYEQHRPDYDMYVKTNLTRANKPSFSEDRFRIVPHRPDMLDFSKHYSSDDVRKGLWHSTMAGGVANIWGNISEQPKEYGSTPFVNAELLKTYSRFFEYRFYVDMVTCNKIDETICLKRTEKDQYIFYAENTDILKLELSKMSESQVAIAVDSKHPYKEIMLDKLSPGQISWHAPYVSDWAIAVGEFTQPTLQ